MAEAELRDGANTVRKQGSLTVTEPDELPSHLRPLLPGRWAIWRDFAVRAPGFSVDGLDDFGPEENERLRSRSLDPLFREAVLWQNPQAARRAVSKIAGASAGTANWKTRQRCELVASYWQRYCAKNETIGFFGPLGWGQFAGDGPAIRVRVGKRLIASREVRFEVWAIEALADAIAANPAVRPSVPAHRRPDRSPEHLPPDHLAAWDLCDGIRPASTIGPADVMDSLERGEYIRIAFPIPLCHDPERELRAQLERLKPEAARRIALTSLDELEDARQGVLAARGPDELDRALAALDEVFIRLTGSAPVRRAGEHYAARTLVYLDCRRDLRIEVGPALRQALAETLDPILAASRWFCGEVAGVCRRIVEKALADLRQELHSDTIPLSALTAIVVPELMALPPEIPDANRRLQDRWAKLLAAPDPEAFAMRAVTAFSDAKPAWLGAIWQAPDVQIAGRSIDDINSGDYLVVLGDFHPTNTLLQGLFTILSPNPGNVISAANLDVPPPRLVFAPDRTRARLTGRNVPMVFGTSDFFILADSKAAVRSGLQGIAAADVMIAGSREGAVVVTNQARVLGPLDDLLATYFHAAAQRVFDPFPPSAHSPRIQLGKSVFRRETWNIPVNECRWAFEPDGARRFAAFTAWTTETAMPRRMFVLAPGGAKPIYVDVQSAVLIEIVAKAVRASGSGPDAANACVRFTEMLPAPEQCWLVDAEGRRYTSELRMVAVDLTAKGASGDLLLGERGVGT